MLDDIRWALNMIRARRWRRRLLFSDRVAFDNAFRPRLEGQPGRVIAYPDAFYHATVEDVGRAMIVSSISRRVA